MQEHLPISFFDDADPSVGFNFLPISHFHPKDFNTAPTINSALMYTHSSSPAAKAAVFSLQKQLLCFYESTNPNKPIKALEIANARLENIPATKTNQNSGFKLTKNGVTIEFYSPKKQTVDSWVACLRKVCVLLSFHDDYHAKKTLGKGGFAKVYLVESKANTKNMFAAKNFQKDSLKASTKEKAKAALLNEVNIMRSVNHDKLVKLYEVHETDNSVYLVMELIKGKTLYDTLKKPYFKRNLSAVRINEIMQSILQAIDYLGANGIMHRDLKPANILIEKTNNVKIADFGLATFVDSDEYLFKKCGTPGYMAPEIFKYNDQVPSTAYDEKCDVFSIGCLFYYMLFGHSFFNGYDPAEVTDLNKAYNMNSLTISNIRKEIINPSSSVDKEALSLLLRLIDADPTKRISASEALAHKYFNPATMQRLRKSISTESSSPFSKNTQSELLSPLTHKNSQNPQNHQLDTSLHDENSAADSYVVPGLNQLTKKDSMFLDVARSKSNGTESLNNFSGTGSILIKDDPNVGLGSNSNNSLSAFGSGHSRSLSKSITQNRSPRNASPFLKAAIINSIHQNTITLDATSAKMKPKAPRIKFGRHNTDYILARDFPIDLNNEEDEMSVPEETSDGKINECSHIQRNFDHINNLTKAMVPSLQAHMSKY